MAHAQHQTGSVGCRKGKIGELEICKRSDSRHMVISEITFIVLLDKNLVSCPDHICMQQCHWPGNETRSNAVFRTVSLVPRLPRSGTGRCKYNIHGKVMKVLGFLKFLQHPVARARTIPSGLILPFDWLTQSTLLQLQELQKA